MRRFNISIVIISLISIFFMTSLGPTEDQTAQFQLADLESFSAGNPFISQLPKPEKPSPVDQDSSPEIINVPISPVQNLLSTNQEQTEIEVPLPQLVITGLVWNSDRPQAIINGNVVSVGDRISDLEIVAIQKTGVDVKFMNKIVTFKP